MKSILKQMEFKYNIQDPIWTIYFDGNWKLILIIRTLICILTLVNNTLFVFVIFKFKQLRTRKNYVMLNFAIVTLLYSIVSTLDVVVDKYYFYSSRQVKTVMNLLLQVSFMQATLVALLKSFQHLANGYQRYFKLVMGLSYCMPLLYIMPFFIAGYHWVKLTSYFTFKIFFVSGITTIIINMIRSNNENGLRKYSSGVWLANIYFLKWVPAMTAMLFILFRRPTYTTYAVYYNAHLVGLLASVITIIVLIRRDKEFIKSYAAIFGKSSSDSLPEDTTNVEDDMIPIINH